MIGGFLPTLVFAEPNNQSYTQQQVELIRSRCPSIKNTLHQLHASDALLRVNRGRVYESTLTRLMDRLNSRLDSNNFGNVNLVSTAGLYKRSLDRFRSNYKAYEEQLSVTLDIDCAKQPELFYQSVMSAREKRKTVHGDVLALNLYIDKYKQDVLQFEKDYRFISEGIKQ